MDSKDAQLKVLAQAVYELKGLLANHLGNRDPETQCESVSAHLAYALHNEALAIIEDRPEDFNVDLGWLHYEDGEFEKAIEAYNMGLQGQPDYVFAFWKRGQAHDALGNIEKSVEDYKSARRIGQETLPNFAQILIDYPDVKANLEKYVELSVSH
tara:strand:+ start:5416 stop:5880 length:465 start_codon:yes stop_codon:yes gene_type:complete